MRTSARMVAVAITALAAATTPAAAQSPGPSGGAPQLPPLPEGWTQVTAGLNGPRGLTVTADGTIYVAESGSGGDAGCIVQPELGHMCFGPSGAISKVEGGVATRVVEGLASGITDTGETLGPSGVALASDGTIWITVGGPGVGAADLRATITGGEGIGQLYKAGADGTATSVADLAAWEVANNPDKDQPDNATPDSNINGLAITKDGAIARGRCGGNDLLSVDSDGTISVVAVFLVEPYPLPPQMIPSPAPGASVDPNAAPPMINMDPVPTSVAIGQDGAYYVGQLTGFPFPKGEASGVQGRAGSRTRRSTRRASPTSSAWRSRPTARSTWRRSATRASPRAPRACPWAACGRSRLAAAPPELITDASADAWWRRGGRGRHRLRQHLRGLPGWWRHRELHARRAELGARRS